MSDPFVGEIRMFAGNFAPRGWAFCDGQLLAVTDNDALFSLFGTMYGGDGRTTFGLPDLRGRIPIHAGTGPGLSPRQIGSKGGAEDVTLTVNELTSHGHALTASTNLADEASPAGNTLAQPSAADLYIPDIPMNQNVDLATASISHRGGSQQHTNLMPFLCIHFIVSLVGIYPSRN